VSESVSREVRGPRALRVSEVLAGLRGLIEERVGRLWICGEISNLHRARSGHVYFTLVDGEGQLRAALFRGSARGLLFDPENGMEVLAYGELTVYEARGELQLVVRQLEPRGDGALRLAIEQLRARLADEGLFAAERKRALPELPARIGVVTSPLAAALRDVLEVSGRRFPSVPILISPTRVQGLGADEEIARAIERIGGVPGVDVVLVVRGGGSLEDLMAFNSERVVRAIAACPVPVVAGVGHEVDVTLADLAADLRAPTPSAAAELVLPERAELAARIGALRARLARAIARSSARPRDRLAHLAAVVRAHAPDRRLEAARQRLAAAQRALARAIAARLAERRGAFERRVEALRAQMPAARVGALAQRCASEHARLVAALARRIERAQQRLAQAAGRLDSLSPLAVLQRGYAIARRAQDGRVVRELADAPIGARLRLRVARAELEVDVAAGRALPAAPLRA
jgi:exodeoxyribonuclease VII large subunit